MTSDSIVQRVTDLIRLAVDGGAADGEARNAALFACKLISKHGLRIGAQVESTNNSYRGYSRHDAPPKQPSAKQDWRNIRSRYETRCKACMKRVQVGELVWWMPGRGVWHDECRP